MKYESPICEKIDIITEDILNGSNEFLIVEKSNTSADYEINIESLFM